MEGVLSLRELLLRPHALLLFHTAGVMAARDPTEDSIVDVARAIGNLGINAREVCMRARTHELVHVDVHDACTCARVGSCRDALVRVLMHTCAHVSMHACTHVCVDSI